MVWDVSGEVQELPGGSRKTLDLLECSFALYVFLVLFIDLASVLPIELLIELPIAYLPRLGAARGTAP